MVAETLWFLSNDPLNKVETFQKIACMYPRQHALITMKKEVGRKNRPAMNR